MDKRFDPRSYESKWQRHWARRGYFTCAVPSAKPSFCIMIPPPNVTGKLHMGHALQYALQDLLTRWKRMQGYNALWLPGTDHAGIATQLMVERALAEEGTSRVALGRERFLERMWAWKERYHGSIRAQLDLLGASCDWTREHFTLDEGLSRAVREAFVRLHGEGLVYRGEYIVNWSPALDTAISDLEVEQRTVAGKLYHVAYPLADAGGDERVVVATTRPETMLGDTAVAFHPEDERYQRLRGRAALLPLRGRRLPFVADAAVEREFGSGLVKITPFHDAADFELARRHGLPGVAVIDRRGRMTAAAGEEFAGLDTATARARVVERLRELGLLVKVEENYTHNVGHSQRSGEPVEPLVSMQWFCNVEPMARQALAVWRDGSLRLLPESWGKTWEHWLENIRPWCISRQVWWGHQIPAWYAPDGACTVARSRAEAAALAGTDELVQDADVLDTWFSSALWPFSTLGWPDDTPDLRAFYPTDVLVTGFDILFFWVARMVMTGTHFTGRSPFHTVHLTGLVRDAEGVKMSKTRRNVLDPAELVEEHGADAVRFTLASLDSPGRDIPLDPQRMAGNRAFGNKIWNATRFALSRVGAARVRREIDPSGLALEERWILSRLSRTAAQVNQDLEDFRFDLACQHLHWFFWSDFCDWYIELAKPALIAKAAAGGAPPAQRIQLGDVLLTVLDHSLRLLHPVMPFLTEELWQRLPGREAVHPETITLAPYPQGDPKWLDEAAEEEVAGLTRLTTRVRNARAEQKVEPRRPVVLYLERAPLFASSLGEHLKTLAGVERTEQGKPAHLSWSGLVENDNLKFAIEPLAAERAQPAGAAQQDAARRREELAKLDEQIARAEADLADAGFLAKAPPRVVEQRRQRLAELRERRALVVPVAGS